MGKFGKGAGSYKGLKELNHLVKFCGALDRDSFRLDGKEEGGEGEKT